MTAKVTNLNKARKAKARAEKTARAKTNAVKFGRTKAEKAADGIEVERHVRHIEQHNIKDD